MIIEETFYNISKSELMSLCNLMNHIDKQDFLMSCLTRIESLVKDKRISELKFKVQVDNESN